MTTPPPAGDPLPPPQASPPIPVATPATRERDRHRRAKMGLVLASVAIVALLVPVLLRLARTNEQGRFAEFEVTIPATVEPKFAIDTKRVTGTFGRLNAVVGNSVNQYDENGNERWSHQFPADENAVLLPYVVDGLVPVQVVKADDTKESRIVFLIEDSGEVTDTRIDYAMSDGEQPLVMAGRLYLISDDAIELYDPASGELLARVDSAEIRPTPHGYIAAATAAGTSVFDYDLHPLVSDVAVEFDRSLQYFDHKIIAVEADAVVAYDESGKAWSTPTGMADLKSVYPIGDHRWVLLSASDEVAIVTGIGGDEVDTIWQSSGVSYVEPVSADRILISRNRSDALIDRDGNELVEAGGSGGLLANNGVILAERLDDGVSLTGVDLDGNELWVITSDASTTSWVDFSIVNDAVFDPGNSTVYGPQ